MSHRFGTSLSRILVTAAVAVVLGAASLSAQKTDVIILINGDHVTGEIKKLERELVRKEKALAEAAALLVLQKKYQALWEEKDE